MTVIETRSLKRTFGDKIALDGIDMRIERGEIFGYLGPNGSGKTTTIRILVGLIRPTLGQAWVLGSDVTRLGPEVRAKIGVVLEDHGLYERLSAYDNLDYYGRIFHMPTSTRQRRINSLLRQVGLWEERNQKVGTFSKGMKQRLALARALLHEPELLFLDEPTAGLDPEATVMVREIIIALAHEERMTIFLSSHNLDEVERLCSRVAILHRGRIKVMDTVENLRRRFSSPKVEIVLRDSQQAIRAQAILSAHPFVIQCRVNTDHIEADLRRDGTSDQLLETLKRENIVVEEIRKTNRTLEELYLYIMHEGEETCD